MNIQPIVTISSIFDAEVTAILFISKFSVHLIGASARMTELPLFLNKETHSSKTERKQEKVIFLKNNFHLTLIPQRMTFEGESKLIYSLGTVLLQHLRKL